MDVDSYRWENRPALIAPLSVFPIDIHWLLLCISNADKAFLEILTPSPWREKQFMAAANPGLGPHG
jgi:hypothetical protein